MYPVGTMRIRTRHKRGGVQRAYVKMAEPNTWTLRARVVWETAHGPVPRGKGIHHRDGDTLNDALENLELVSKARHIDLHRADFAERRAAAVGDARRRQRWSTRSATKRTGRHPNGCTCPLHAEPD